MVHPLVSIVAGAAVPLVSAWSAGQLIAPRTRLPATIRFTLGAIAVSLLHFIALSLELGYLATWLTLCGALTVTALATRQSHPSEPNESTPVFPLVIVTTYALIYLIYALAPEIQPDAVGYHLRLVADHIRTHSLGDRISFYDVLPQPLEMLFTPAVAIGGPSAARLVHFAFLLTAALGIRTLAATTLTGWLAAIMFLAAPAAGIAGTSAYTDLALVCATTTGIYLLGRAEPALIALAGACAGFAYALKPTFGVAGLAALLYLAIRTRRLKAPALFALGAAVIAGPWLWHAWSLTGNPVAPFLTRFFPNTATTAEVEHRLVRLFNAFRPDFAWHTAILDYTVRGGNAGLLGPAFLLAPLTLLALRNKAQRWLLAAAAMLALPVLANTGTRFLLPAAAPVVLALASMLPPPAALAVVTIQALAPLVPRGEWHLGPIPVRAALRLTPEAEYLAQTLPGYDMVEPIHRFVPATSRILACTAIPEAYIARETLVYWQSRQGMEFTDLLRFAYLSPSAPARLLSWRWPAGHPERIRLTAKAEFRLIEASAPHRAWQQFTPGQVFNIPGAGKTDILLWPDDQAQLRIEANSREISSEAERSRVPIDLRRDITQYIRRAGFRYLIMPAENNAFADITKDMRGHPGDWGITELANGRSLYLFRIREHN